MTSITSNLAIYYEQSIHPMRPTFKPPFVSADSSSKQCLGIYPRRLVGGRRLPSPSAHRRRCVRCTSRRWRLLVYAGQGRTAQEPTPEGARWPQTIPPPAPADVSKCAFNKGSIKRGERPGHPRAFPLRFPPADRSPPSHPRKKVQT